MYTNNGPRGFFVWRAKESCKNIDERVGKEKRLKDTGGVPNSRVQGDSYHPLGTSF